jgi:two-component system response regulator RegA
MESPDNERSVLILDDHESFAAHLGRSFCGLGFAVWLCSDLEQAEHVSQQRRLSLVVTELRVGRQWALDFVDKLRVNCPNAPFIIATAYPSIATAVRAMAKGFRGYLAKPVNVAAIVDMVYREDARPPEADPPPPNWPSLDRTIWEYINHVYVCSGTMSEAARRLRIDRRSLRRMLGKYPPAL